MPKAGRSYPRGKSVAIDAYGNLGKLANVLRDRIAAVFRKYGLEPTSEGWRELALELMLKCEPEMKVRPGQLDVSPHLTEFANISLQSWDGKKTSVYSVAKKLYGKRRNTLRTRYSENKKRRTERIAAGQPENPNAHFHAALTLAVLAVEKGIKNK
jgi:hypothetical protein